MTVGSTSVGTRKPGHFQTSKLALRAPRRMEDAGASVRKVMMIFSAAPVAGACWILRHCVNGLDGDFSNGLYGCSLFTEVWGNPRASC